MSIVYKRPDVFTDEYMKYCGGCGHGIINRVIGELIEEMNLQEKAVFVWPIGCSVYADKYFKVDSICALHGRAPAVGTGVKRATPDNLVIVYQGDGDLASIGAAEIVHCAARGENISTIFINNGIYGMTGGQMAPTTLPGMKATTCQSGRDVKVNGNPIHVSEMLATLDGPAFIERVSVDSAPNVIKAKKAIKKALECQMKGLGFSMVEVVSSCPTNWGMTAVKAMEFVREKMIPFYPLGVYKDITEEAK